MGRLTGEQGPGPIPSGDTSTHEGCSINVYASQRNRKQMGGTRGSLHLACEALCDSRFPPLFLIPSWVG